MASGWFGKQEPDVRVQIADREPNNFYLPSSNKTSPVPPVGNTDRTHSKLHVHTASLFDIGILKDTLAPSLGLHSGLAIIAWGAARYTGRLEAKDWLWPSGQVANAWWSAVGRRLYQGLTLSQALHRLSWHERLVLSGVTLWGGRLFYRIARRSIKRGTDDPRYDEEKKEDNFWNKSLFTTFIPEAFFQMLISLPFTAPFRHEGAVLMGYHPFVQMVAVGLFSTGLALETLADYQLDQYKAEGGKGILKEGVWSIVRNPKYANSPLASYTRANGATATLVTPLCTFLLSFSCMVQICWHPSNSLDPLQITCFCDSSAATSRKKHTKNVATPSHTPRSSPSWRNSAMRRTRSGRQRRSSATNGCGPWSESVVSV